MGNEIIQKLLKNKYWVILIIFAVWMFLFDSNSVFTHYELNKELKAVNQEKEFLKETINKEKKEYNRLKKYPSEMERLAREKYFFKRENEDVFIIETQKEKK